METSHLVNSRGARILATSLTLILASLCFIQWFRFASAYSGMIGLNSEAGHVASTKQIAIICFVGLIGLECVATALIVGFLPLRMFESRVVSLISRIVTALATTILITCMLVSVIAWVMGHIS